MFLSRLTPNLRNSGARRDLANRYELHRSLARQCANLEGRVLFRIEPTTQAHTCLLVQTSSAPDWQPLLANGYLQHAESKEWDPSRSLRQGGIYRFRIDANPTTSKFSESGQRGRLQGVKGIEHQYAWFQRKATIGGFTPLGFQIVEDRIDQFSKEGHTITVQGVLYEGHLRIDQLEPFLQTVQQGIGRGRGFGYGLLSVAPG